MILSHRYLRLLPEAMDRLYAETNFDALPQHLYATMQDIMPCDGMTIAWHYPATKPVVGHVVPDAVNESLWNSFGHHSHEHPALRMLLQTRRPLCTKLSDHMSLRELRDTGLYQDCYSQIGWKYQMGCGYFDHPHFPLFTFSFTRNLSDFTEEEKFIAALLGPHLQQASANLCASKELREGEVVYFDAAAGVVVRSTRQASAWLADYFGAEAAIRMPSWVLKWATAEREKSKGRASTYRVLQPYEVAGKSGKLKLELVLFEERPVHAIVLSEERQVTETSLRKLSLSRKQTEILYWIVQGKTNAEIALILEANRRTVEKHVERIFDRMGVENRLAAAMMARELALV